MNFSNDNSFKETSPGHDSLALLLSEDEGDVQDLFVSEDESDVEDVYATCNESDGIENDLDGKPILPATISINRIGDVNSNKATISPKFGDVNGGKRIVAF